MMMRVKITVEGDDVKWVTPEVLDKAAEAAESVLNRNAITWPYLKKFEAEEAKYRHLALASRLKAGLDERQEYKVRKQARAAASDVIAKAMPDDWIGAYSIFMGEP